MKGNTLHRAAWLLLFVLLVPMATSHAQQATDGKKHLTLEEIHASSTFSPDGFRGGRWAEEGPIVTYIERADDATNLISYNLETDERTTLIDGSKLYADDVDRLIRIEGYEYTRDGKKVLIYTDSERVWRLNTKGYYYIYDLEAETLTPIADRDAGFQMFAKFSPDGRYVGFVRDRNLFLVDASTMEVAQLTDSGSPGGIINGTSDWVYEEEFGLRDGWSWSPDSRYISFVQLDETNTHEFVMNDLRGQYPVVERFRYPKAGEVNSEIHVGVIDVTSDARTPLFFDTKTWQEGGTEFEYIPQMGWTPEIDGQSMVWMFRLNRDQNDLDLLYGNPANGEVSTVLEETLDSWIDVETGFSDLDVGQLTYLDDGRHFVWISEKDGYRHLYLYDNDGTFVRRLTEGEWDVTDFHGIDEATGTVYFTATIESPMERQLYRVSMASNGTDGASEPVRITERSGWHGINPSSDLRYYIDTFSDIDTPPVVTLNMMDGERMKLLEGNEELQTTLAEYALPSPEFMQVPGADGTMLNAYIIKPTDFDSEKTYPLLMYVYGGPGSQTVRDAWGGSRTLWHQYLAEEHEVLVASVDNRGTGARGKAFKSGTYKHLGIQEAQDQIAAAQYFGTLDYIDQDRIGIWGWSYGGYMTLMSLLYGDGPETFKAGVSVAPVTDWRQYDTIYTERYMSTPQANPEGYETSAPLHYADRLAPDQHLLIVHGDLDDNVHFQNTIQMIDALQEANKQFDLMVYPGRNHGIYGGNARLHLFTLATDFILQSLKPNAEPVRIEGASR